MRISAQNARAPGVSYLWRTFHRMKIIIRPQYNFFHAERLHFAIEKLLYTTYTRGAKYEDAPLSTDCVTAVRWLLSLSSDFLLPVEYIGDLPRKLTTLWCTIHPLAEVKEWDIIFFEKMSKTHKKYMVTHVWLMISSTQFIHSSSAHHGKISRIDDEEYIHTILHESFLEIAKDPRNHS